MQSKIISNETIFAYHFVHDCFYYLNKTINEATGNVIVLPHNYHYYNAIDTLFINGVPITQNNLVIDGNGSTINGSNLARIFQVTGSNITFKNINFVNGNAGTGHGGAIFFQSNSNNNNLINCNFTNNHGDWGGAIIFYSDSNNNTLENGTCSKHDG